jgi:primosomal protein N' (replication factor Y)
VVGARSALFAPFRNLGLIVVDEEHETTYKQEEAPRYHARDVAVVRGRMENATVLLGTATPSLESYHNCQAGKYTLCELRTRADNRKMPIMELVDMRAEAMLRGRAQVFSRRLADLVRGKLEAGEQTILFLNRRGYATQLLCPKCGYVAMCEDCSTPYTYHRGRGSLCCHLCGRTVGAPQRCPQCRDPAIRYLGLGTEKVEEVARKLFPHVEIGRMDSDTMTARDSYRKMLSAFKSGHVRILIGTQMIAKGLHFPNVTLVGVIFADLSLHLPDFRSAERTYQLLTQVAGRAGRGEVPGRVIVQTYTPFHPALEFAMENNAKAFYAEELDARATLGFPPATHMVAVHFRGVDAAKTLHAAEAMAARLRASLDPRVKLAGPVPAPIARVRSQYRYQLMLRTGNIVRLVRALRPLAMETRAAADVHMHVDVDPLSLL